MKVEHIQLGKIVGVWGVKGWVKVHSFTRNRTEIGDYSKWLLKLPNGSDLTKCKVLNCRSQGQGLAAQLEGVNDRDQAQAMIGQTIWVSQSDLPTLSEGEFYWRELIGLQVFNTEKKLLGEVSSIMETGANDVLVIKQAADSNEEVLIPYVDEVVSSIDVAQNSIVVDWDLSYLDD